MSNELTLHNIRILHFIELEILKEFGQICEKHNLNYCITAGTLLGAVRHKGFIPWDDDIDVVMPRKDFDRLGKICLNYLPTELFYQNYQTEANYPFYFAKLRKNNTEVCEESLIDVQMHKGVYIDIFPLDKCPKGKIFGKLFFKMMELLNCLVITKVNRSFVCGYKKKYMRFVFAVLKYLPKRLLISMREIWRVLVGILSSGECLCTVGGAHGYPRETYKKEWFAESVLLEFEGAQYPAPVGWRELLTNMYGDYMQLPDEPERTGHFISWERGK